MDREIKEHILWILQEAPKLLEGKDFREDNWGVIKEQLIDRLQEPDQKQPEGLEEETEAEKKEREDQEVEMWGRTN
jgi:hypothetical protein